MEGGQEPEGEKQPKRLNDDFLYFMRKKSGADIAKYKTHLKKYVDVQRKRQRAEDARRHYEARKRRSLHKSNAEHDKQDELNDKKASNQEDNHVTKKHQDDPADRRRGDKSAHSSRSWFRSSSSVREPSDGCGRRTRRKKCSCGKKRRRRRSRRRHQRSRGRRRRKSCRRKRRRSCGRRKRKSCGRKRRRSRCKRRHRRC